MASALHLSGLFFETGRPRIEIAMAVTLQRVAEMSDRTVSFSIADDVSPAGEDGRAVKDGRSTWLAAG
jgi:hypothetical protein